MVTKHIHQDVSIKILLVDDEINYVNVLANRLAKRNIFATRTYTGTQAIQALRKEDFDVVILDLKLEDMDGIEVLKIMKKMVPDVNVIMLTGHGSEEAAREGLREGAYDYLTKPCAFADLIYKIREVYDRHKGIR
ncbi:MAG: response regulator [Desulfobacteraceae bacterium]|jgi:DNA-binding response OmpR family regulator